MTTEKPAWNELHELKWGDMLRDETWSGRLANFYAFTEPAAEKILNKHRTPGTGFTWEHTAELLRPHLKDFILEDVKRYRTYQALRKSFPHE